MLWQISVLSVCTPSTITFRLYVEGTGAIAIDWLKDLGYTKIRWTTKTGTVTETSWNIDLGSPNTMSQNVDYTIQTNMYVLARAQGSVYYQVSK